MYGVILSGSGSSSGVLLGSGVSVGAVFGTITGFHAGTSSGNVKGSGLVPGMYFDIADGKPPLEVLSPLNTAWASSGKSTICFADNGNCV